IKFLIYTAYSVTNKTMVLWLSKDLGFTDQAAGALVGWVWAPAMTVFTLLAGSVTDAIGLRRTFFLGVAICTIARSVMVVTTIPSLALACGVLAPRHRFGDRDRTISRNSHILEPYRRHGASKRDRHRASFPAAGQSIRFLPASPFLSLHRISESHFFADGLCVSEVRHSRTRLVRASWKNFRDQRCRHHHSGADRWCADAKVLGVPGRRLWRSDRCRGVMYGGVSK